MAKRRNLETRAERQTVDTPKAPGSASDFTGLPKRKEDIAVSTPKSEMSEHMREHIDLVRREFRFVFKNILDKEHFEGKVYFRDPITKVPFSLFRGYQAVVQFLRFFLAPIFEIHEVRQAGEQEILVKWSWTMNFWWNRFNPLKFLWDPRLAFSGITVLGYDPKSGKWNKHVDAWDAIRDNEFFSLEGFVFAFSQMLSVSTPPNRFTPEFQIYKKYKDWEIRRYRPYLSASISLDELKNSGEAVGPGPGIKEEVERAQLVKAEAMVERYLAIGNDREEYFELTTPLFISKDKVYSLLVPGYKEVEDLPQPHKSELVKLTKRPEQFYASVSFSGQPSEKQLQEKLKFLRAKFEENGCKADGNDWQFARYNKEGMLSPKGPFRRNDLLVPLQAESVDLWRDVDWAFVDRIVKHQV